MEEITYPMLVLADVPDIELTFRLQSSDTKLHNGFRFVLTLENRMWGMIAAKVWPLYCSMN